MADLRARLAERWGRHLVAAPEHWGIDWAIAEDDKPGARVTALAAHVITGESLKQAKEVLVYAPVWVTLRTLSDRLRVPHMVVAEFEDAILYRVWPPISGIYYPVKLIEDFIFASIQLAPEEWKTL